MASLIPTWSSLAADRRARPNAERRWASCQQSSSGCSQAPRPGRVRARVVDDDRLAVDLGHGEPQED